MPAARSAFPDLDLALDQIIADLATEPGMRQLSISLGLGETFMGSADGEVATENQKFLTLCGRRCQRFRVDGRRRLKP